MSSRYLILAPLGLSGCISGAWVNGISTSPDGKVVEVVGASYNKDMLTAELSVHQPYRWTCVRAANGILSCKRINTQLPRKESEDD